MKRKSAPARLAVVAGADQSNKMVGNRPLKSVLERISSGDRTAVQDCLERYGALVWSLARRLTPDRNDAEDAVQEIFIDLWKSAGRFDPAQSSEMTFIAMIARRRLIDRRRAIERRPQVEELSEEEASSHDKQIETSADAARATRAMTQLRPEQQRVLQLAIWYGLSHQEISQTTGMPLGTVKTYLRRGLSKIREALGVRTLDHLEEVSK